MRALLSAVMAFGLLMMGCTLGGCPDTVDQVCGSDGVTYPNSCLADAAGADVAAKGACEFCSDGDGGKDIFTAGSAKWKGGSLADSCNGTKAVAEAYCEGKSGASEILPCPEGYACSDSACVKVPCSDSDSGKNANVFGSVIAGSATYQDACAGPDAVREYFCEGGIAASEQLACGAGKECSAGACVESPCTDTDGGKNATKAGNVTKGNDAYSDACLGASSVKEYYCDNKTVRSETLPCGSGFSCAAGACARNVCKDTDGGKDQFARGTASYENKSSTDDCYSGYVVLEYYCSSDTDISSEKINCGAGMECSLGQCKAVTCSKNETDVLVEDAQHKIATFGESRELKMFVDNIVMINDGMMLEVASVSENKTTVRLYEDYDAYKDDDYICSESIDDGEAMEDLCEENTVQVEVLGLNDADEYAMLGIEEYSVLQIYSQEGTITEWTDNPICQEGTEEFESYAADFYPYLDTQSDGLNLDGKKIKLFGGMATIREVTEDSVTLYIDGDDFEMQDGDTFEYKDADYAVQLDFNDGGLYRIEAEPD